MFKLIYKMTKDGNDKKYFHEKCDGKRFTVILVLTEKKIFQMIQKLLLMIFQQ